MYSKPPRLRLRQATPTTALSVSTLAGLIAAALALFVLGAWLAVILIRRRRSRHRSTGGIRGRQKDRVPDEEADHKQEITDNAEGVERRSLNRNIKSSSQYVHAGQTGDEFKFDPNTALGMNSRVPSSQDESTQFGNSNITQSIVLPSLSPGYFQGAGSPYSAQSSSWNSPSSSSPLYTSPNPTTSKNFTTPVPVRSGPRTTAALPNVAGPSSSSRTLLKARTPSHLSRSFSIVDPQEVTDMPELPSGQPLTRRKSDAQRPRKLEKRRRSGSLRRRDSKSRERIGTSDEDMQEKGKGLAEKMPQIHLRHASSQLPLSDSDQSSRTIVPSKTKTPTPTPNPPSSFNSNPPTLTRQRSGIRQPGDANHLRPPKDGASYGSGSMGPLSLVASSSENSHGTLATLIQPSTPMQSFVAPTTSALSPEPSHGQPTWRPQPSPRPWQGQQPLFSAPYGTENDVLAFHKAAGNVPKPFKPFAFQFPQRSPVISNASNSRPTFPVHGENGSSNIGHFAALVAAAGLSVSPSGSPSPSPLGRNMPPGSNMVGRASTDGLGAMPGRPSTDVLAAFPPRSSTDALNNFGNQESRHSLQSGYSVEAPWDGQEGVPSASSPSVFSFSTDLYGYGGGGPASTSNSIDLYRRVDPATLFPGSAPPVAGFSGAEVEGRHSLSLLGGEPLSAAELDSRGLKMRRFREGHASVSSFAAFGIPTAEDGRSTRTPSWTLEALRENLFGAASAHRRGQDSVASSSVGSQSRRSSVSPWNVALGIPVGPPALASPRDVNFQFPVAQGQNGLVGPLGAHSCAQWNHQHAGPSNQLSDHSNSETRMRTVVRAFAPLLPDELVLRPGEELAVLQEFDDGWCVVAREGLGSNGAPTPPGLLDPEDSILPAGDASSTTGSSTSSRRRILEVGTCPSWVFDDASPTNGEFTRPMRSTSLGITVSMRLPPVAASHSVMGGSIRESPLSTNMPLASIGQPYVNDSASQNRPFRTATPIREEVVSWSNF